MDYRKLVGVTVLICALSLGLLAQTKVVQVSEVPESFCVSEAESMLYRMINEYRRQYDLPPIPLSASLCYVANTHVKDLFFHNPDVDPCNFHSWSDKGPWKPFCYPGDEDKKNSVWDKPKELAGYPGKGFEIVYWENNNVVIDSVIAFWRSFDYFNSFLMNTGKWEGKQWKAIGIGICQNYAAAWFGEVSDTKGVPDVCGQKQARPMQDTTKKASPPASAQPASGLKGNPVSQTVSSPQGENPAVTATQAAADHYYIIVKSQLPLPEAEKVVRQLLDKGFTQARILKNGDKVRVSMYDTADRDESLKLLREAKTIYKDAWLFKQ